MQRCNFFHAGFPAIVMFVLLLCAGATTLHAQLSTGKVEGIVRDKDTGVPLRGAQVTIEGTRLGNVTNADGYYFILNVPPGQRSVTFAFTGYQKVTVADRLILAGQTATVGANLSSAVVQLEGITIKGEDNPLVPRDNTVTKRRLTAEGINEIPASTLEEMMILEAGVQVGGDGGLSRGIRIRGGRVGEEAMVVDGVMVRNYTADPSRSGAGWVWEQEAGSLGEDTNPLDFSASSVEEVDILTGGFQAEYGNAQSGIINIVTKEGGPHLKGNLRYTTDGLNNETADYGYNQLRASLGGPVSPIPNLYFNVSGEIQGMLDRSPTHADEGFRGINQKFVDRLNDAVRNDPFYTDHVGPVFTLDELRKGREFYAGKTGADPALFMPENKVLQPNNWRDRTMLSSKLTYSPLHGLKVIGSFNYSRAQNSYPTSYFNTGLVTQSMMPTRDWSQQAPDTTMFINPALARRTRTTNSLAGFDWNIFQSATRRASLQFRYSYFYSQDITSASQEQNYRRSNDFLSWSLHDVRFEIDRYPNKEFPVTAEDKFRYFPNGLGGRNSQDYTITTPFSQAYANLYYLSYFYLIETQNNYKADLDVQLDRYNRSKIGFQFSEFSNNKFETHVIRKFRNPQNEFNYRPQLFAAYIQNRTDLGDFVMNYGLRYDLFRPVDNWGLRFNDPYEERFFPKDKSEFSPRFDAAFPVTDRSQLRFSYGVFTQLPQFNSIFNGTNPGGLGFARTDAFEVGFTNLLSDDLVLDVVTYYRDIDGNVGKRQYFRDFYMSHQQERVRTWTEGVSNRDSGNIKGIDFSLKKRFSNNFSFDVNYTLQFSRTTGSGVTGVSTYAATRDISTGESFVWPDNLRPINDDRTHQISARLNYVFPADFLQGTWANKMLANLRIYPVFTLESGRPVPENTSTRRFDSVGPSETNYFRERWNPNIDLRVNKMFSLGSSARLSVFAEIFNLLNRELSARYPTNYVSDTPRFRPTGGVDLNWNDETLTDFQRAWFQADFNQDGILSVEESTKGAMADALIAATSNYQDWGRARQVRLGLELNY